MRLTALVTKQQGNTNYYH